MIRKVMAVLTLVLLVQGCATTGTATAADGSTSQTTTGRTNVITAEELAQHPEFATVAEAVQRLRPRWRAATIYINDRQHVGASSDITMFNVKEIRYLDVSEAQMNWGQSIEGRVIQVITR